MCQDARCVEQKFVVFESEIDLQAHKLSEHMQDFAGNKRALAAARRIDSSFSFNSIPANIQIGNSSQSSSSNQRRNNNKRGGGVNSGNGRRNDNSQNNNGSSSSTSVGTHGRRNVVFSGQLSSQQANGGTAEPESLLGLRIPSPENDDLVVYVFILLFIVVLLVLLKFMCLIYSRHQIFLHRLEEITNNTPSKLTSFKLSGKLKR